ncbi:epimerase [Gracilaria domingensis]|nr:epimerase [Gracilaria domingensis]
MRKRPTRKSSAFERTIDDLTMKRMGKGTIYYGPRATPDLTEQSTEEDQYDFLKPDPVLITGATGRTGQWIALGLINQEFNVRTFSRSYDRTEKIFGPSGSNVDVFEGDLANYEEVRDAVEGSKAIVCASGAPRWLPGGFKAVDVTGVSNLVKAACETGSVSRFVLISTVGSSGARESAKREAEKIVLGSGLPYVILRVKKLEDTPGGVKDIVLTSVSESDASITFSSGISRVDAAQVVCQALVYERTISQLSDADPNSEFDFPNCIITASNGRNSPVPDKRFWKREFNRISDACREKSLP